MTDLDADELLQRCRRVDWRFLLDEPDLGRVAVVGAAADDEELVDAIGVVASSCDTEPSAGSSPDVAVARDGHAELFAAAGLVRAGGVVVVETTGRSSGRVVSSLRALGFPDAQAHWQWPDHTSCLEIVALDDRVALRHALARRGASGSGALRARLAAVLVRLGLFARTVSAATVVGTKAAS